MTITIKTLWRSPAEAMDEDSGIKVQRTEREVRDYWINKALLHKVGLVHIFNPDCAKGGLTIAFKKTNPYKSGAMVSCAVATCSRHDVFSKKIGAQRAIELYFAGETIQLPLLQWYEKDDLSYVVKKAFTKLYEAM